jgi:riboflavin kinase / FMN adenylyltransferase
VIVLRGHPLEWEVPGLTAVTVGVFDGVHVGHRRVLADLVAPARHKGLLPTVVTFDPHPLHFLAPDRAPQMLTSVEQRIEQFRHIGIEVSGVLYFPDIRDLTAEDFVTQVLISALQTDWVVVGADFRFGRNRGGDAVLLQRMGEAAGFQVSIVDMYGPREGVVSSTRVRALLGEGKVEEAALLLDRHYELTGVVQPGDGRGRTIGFPTANLAVAPELLVPANGVYACRVTGDSQLRNAVVNIGTRPTFGGQDRRVEAFLFDFEGDLYGRELSVRFVARIREERTFAGVDDLRLQIEADAAAARVLLDG